MDTTVETFERYVVDNWGGNDDTPRDGGLRDLYIMSTGLGGENGEILELLKKHIRDGRDIRADLLLEAGDLLHYLTRIVHMFGYSLDDVMLANMEKLDARFGRTPMKKT